jgi:hypothetical protein
MDSILLFGHEYDGQNACRDSIASLARQVAEKVAEAKGVFPDIQVGDAEPIGNTSNPRWLPDLEEWTRAYHSATGSPLAFHHFDVDWANPNWREQLQAGVRLMNAAGIPIGVIYNGSKRETSGREWVAKAVEHFHEVQDKLKIRPRFAVIQSWNQYPERMVPETDPDTLSYVVREYSHTEKRN